MAEVKIVMTGHGRGEVFVDGHKVEGVRSVEFSASVGREANVLTLEMIPRRVEIEGPAHVVEAPMVEFLRPRLSWWKRLLGLTDCGHLPPDRNPTPGSNPPAGYQPRPAPPPNPPPRNP